MAVAALERAADLTPDPHHRATRKLLAAEVAMSTGDVARAAALAAALPAAQLDSRAQLRLKLLNAQLDPTAAADPARVLDMVGVAHGLTENGATGSGLALPRPRRSTAVDGRQRRGNPRRDPIGRHHCPGCRHRPPPALGVRHDRPTRTRRRRHRRRATTGPVPA